MFKLTLSTSVGIGCIVCYHLYQSFIHKQDLKENDEIIDIYNDNKDEVLIFGYLRCIHNDKFAIPPMIVSICCIYYEQSLEEEFIKLMMEMSKNEEKSVNNDCSNEMFKIHGPNMVLPSNALVIQKKTGSNTVYGTQIIDGKQYDMWYEWIFKIKRKNGDLISIGIDTAYNYAISKNFTDETSFYGYWDDPDRDANGFSYDSTGNIINGSTSIDHTEGYSNGDYIGMVVYKRYIMYFKNDKKMAEMEIYHSKFVMAVSLEKAFDSVELIRFKKRKYIKI